MRWRIITSLVFCVSIVTSAAQGGQFVWTYSSSGHVAWHIHEGDLGVYEVFLPVSHPTPWPVVCFIHGAGGEFPDKNHPEMTQIEAMAPILGRWAAENGFAVIVPRYQADEYAEYSAPSQLFRMHDWQWRAEDHLGLALEWLRPTGLLNLEKFAFVGHSLGTMISLKIADSHSVRPNIPVPRVMVLFDPAGYEFVPLLATSPQWHLLRGQNYNTTAYERFPTISPSTHLVCMVAESTWYYSCGYAAPGISFGNSNAGGVVSRAWHNTPCSKKHLLVVLSDYRNGILSEHGSAVDGSPLTSLYWKHAASACKGAFGGTTYHPMSLYELYPMYDSRTRTWYPTSPKFIELSGVYSPVPYVWDTGMVLPRVVDATIPGPLSGEDKLRFLLDVLVENDPIVEPADLEALAELPEDGDTAFLENVLGNGLSWHIMDALVGASLPCTSCRRLNVTRGGVRRDTALTCTCVTCPHSSTRRVGIRFGRTECRSDGTRTDVADSVSNAVLEADSRRHPVAKLTTRCSRGAGSVRSDLGS